MGKAGKFLYHSLLYMFLMVCMFVSQAIADPVIVAQTGANSDLSNPRQIVRTTTGRIYYLNGNAGRTSTWDGWIEVQTSGNGTSWSKESTRDQWYLGSDIGVSIDGKNILHVVSYDWNHRPYYMRYNTADSPTANFTWDGYELLETTKTSNIGKSAVAVDANGKPHVVYQSLESYKGNTYYTLTYANRVGSVWSKVAIWPLTLKTNFSGKIEIAIGHDNIPYILMGNKILRGNANAATSFESKDLGTAGTSFVIQQNGDVTVSQVINGKYATISHASTSPWSSGWTLQESTTPDTGSTLLLANGTLYAARLKPDGIWLQKNLDPPFLAASQPANTTWQSLTARWSTYNHSKLGAIDLGTRSWNQQSGNMFWYSANLANSRANFYGGPFIGSAPLSVSLFDSSIPREGSSITSWQWDFDNDGTADASGSNATHLYTTPGKYSVSLAVTDSSGGQDKIVMQNLVQVDSDSDGDGIPNSLDNCPFDYNPLQIDLNVNGIGDTCEPPLNRIASATYMTKLRSMTAAERNISNVTPAMTDGLLEASSVLSPSTYDSISFSINKEARNIKKLTLEYYARGTTGNSTNTYAYIMPYNSDFSTTVDAGIMGSVYNGWNVVDLTPILHRMDGFGKVKFRLTSRYNGFSVHEMNVIEKVDEKELITTPSAVNFGAVEIPKRSVQNLVIQSAGAETLKIVGVREPSAPFAIDSDNCSGTTLTPNTSCSVSVAFAPGYNISHQDELIINSNDAEQSSKRIKLTGTGALVLSGTVKDASTNQPLSNVTVTVTDSVQTRTVTTDSNGIYVLTGVSAGDCSTSFSLAEYKTLTIRSVIKPSQVTTLDAQLIFNYASINGVITDQTTGQPLSGAKVTLMLSKIGSKNPADKQYLCSKATDLSFAEYVLFEDNDAQKSSCKGYYDVTGNVIGGNIKFRVRNPYGRDPFSVTWNGIAAHSDVATEFLAQSFKPGKNGQLTRVGFYLNGALDYYLKGEVHVLLKSALGGDRGTYLAKSNSISFNTGQNIGSRWVFFDFPTPTNVTAGQQYYLEINGMYFSWAGSSGYLYNLNWADTATTTQGAGYQRNGGLWKETKPLAFQTFIDAQSDVSTQADGVNYSSMYGANDVKLSYIIVKQNETTGYVVPTNIDSTDDGIGYWGKYNGDDLTAQGSVTANFEQYYDANGWIEVIASTNSRWLSNLVTDQFSLTFNRTYTATTDTNGAYSFPSLPAGNYSITFDKTAYNVAIISGDLSPGQNITLASPLTLAATATLQGTVFGSITSAGMAGISVTVTDALGNKISTITDAAGNYHASGIVAGAFNVTFAAPMMTTQTSSGILAPGQTLELRVWIAPAPVTLTITAPSDGSIISTPMMTVTGTTTNAETVTVSVIKAGNALAYPATVLNNTYSATIPIDAGQMQIYVDASNSYGRYAETHVTVTRAEFILNNIGDSGNVTMMEFTGNYDAKNPDGSKNDQPRKAVAAEYFKSHPDKDFLVFFSTFDYAMPEAVAQGFYAEVKNDTQGINRTILDNSAQYGSAGMLQGTIDMGNVTPLANNQYGPSLEKALTTINHELGHRWLAGVRFKNPDGTPNTSLIGRDSAHWSYLLDSKGSLMYGNGWKDNGDGTFTSVSTRNSFSPLDLYLMGMIPKEQVPPMLLIDNLGIDKTKLPELGATITGTAKTVTINDIIAAEGERTPNAATSQKQFNIGFILLTRPGDNTTVATQAIETLRKAWAGRFAELTQGKGGVANVPASLEISVDSPADGATITGPDVTVSGTVINTSGAETGITVNGMPATVSGNRFIVNHVPLIEGANSIEIKTTDAKGLTTTTTRSVTASPGHFIRITTNIESGTAPMEISLRLDGSFNITSPQVSYTGPVPVTLTQAASPTEYTATLTAEGTYTYSASAAGPDGQTYSDIVTITVMNRWQLDNQLRAKWENMRTALAVGDVATAVTNFNPLTMEIYREQFTSLSTSLPSIAAGMRNIILVKIEDDQAEYDMLDTINGTEYSFYLLFVKGGDGIWKIRNF